MQNLVFPESAASAFLVFRYAEVFLAVCRFRSFAQAAKTLHLSTSAVSQTISAFESALGVTLFDRSTRPIVLTPEALVLANKLLKACSNVSSAAQSLQTENGKRPALLIGLIESACQSLGADLIEKLQPKFSKIAVLTNSIDSLVNKLKHGQIELFVSSHGIEEDASLSRIRIYSEPLVAVVPSELKILSSNFSTDNLFCCGLPLIWAPEGTHNRRLMEDLCSSLGWTPPQVIEVESQSVALELVSRGLGWYISQPLCLYPARSLFSKLRIFAFEDTHAARDLYLISLRGHESPALPLVRNFICNWLAVEMPKAFANTAVADRIRESVNEL